MQVRKQQEEKAPFKPFDLVISVESEEEAKALYAIFNYIHNIALLSECFSDRILGEIGPAYYVQDGSVIANGVTYNEYYHPERSN